MIPAKNQKDPKLQDLLLSINEQDYPKDKVEVLVISEGDSESAKALGIRKSKGKICAMFCADNFLCDPSLFKKVNQKLKFSGACYERHYAYLKEDNSLNRYFSLIGGNDPVCYYMGKNDREPWVESLTIRRGIPSYGCNGFFVNREWFKYTDLDHYYPMDAHVDMQKHGLSYFQLNQGTVWHRTSDNLFTFMRKRYKYARDLFCDRQDRRWKVISGNEDYWQLFRFIISVITVVPLILTSSRGYREIKDIAWFWHWPICACFLAVYGLLTFRCFFLSLFRRLGVTLLLENVLNLFGRRQTKTMKSLR